MINVRALANNAIQAVNPNIAINWIRSTGGYTTAVDGSRTAAQDVTIVQAQVQATSAGDLAHLDGLNVQGVSRSVHLYGNVQGVVRADQKGGDILQFPEVRGGVVRSWRVISVMETWSTWCRVLAILQNP